MKHGSTHPSNCQTRPYEMTISDQKEECRRVTAHPPTTQARSHSYPYAESKDSQSLPPRLRQVLRKNAPRLLRMTIPSSIAQMIYGAFVWTRKVA
jgi:hypothetical protein